MDARAVWLVGLPWERLNVVSVLGAFTMAMLCSIAVYVLHEDLAAVRPSGSRFSFAVGSPHATS